MLLAPPAYVRPTIDNEFKPSVQDWRQFQTDYSVLQRAIREVTVGEATYPFRECATGRFLPPRCAQFRDGEFVVDATGNFFVGRGPTLSTAMQDWSNQIHIAFQQLFGQRLFEMNEVDRLKWEVLKSVIDVDVYENARPLTVRRIGQAIDMRNRHQKIRWVSGVTETWSPENVPPEMAGFQPGQWFEAFADLDKETGRILKIRTVQRLPQFGRLSVSQIQSAFDGWATTSRLPEATWD